ncbi:MAG: hypothetical protein JW934_04290 [Anaerolineae bacterium]|nr:hypothetical protein [Anaerolineae bacterium]
MLNIQSGQLLKWLQPNIFKMEYELRAGDEPVATLRFRSAFGTLATAESADGCWTFKRVGCFQNRVTARTCDSETDLATFNNNTWKNGGTLILVDGCEFPVTSNFWQTKWGLSHQSAEVNVLPAGEDLPELPWMILLGWYLAVMMHTDAIAASVTTMVAAMGQDGGRISLAPKRAARLAVP